MGKTYRGLDKKQKKKFKESRKNRKTKRVTQEDYGYKEKPRENRYQ